MEFEEYKQEEQGEEDYVDIYSRKAIFGFSIFSYLYAGVLLCINLWAAGFKRAISQVLLFILGYYFLCLFIIKSLHIKVDLVALQKYASGTTQITSIYQILPALELLVLGISLNIIAGLVLTMYFFKKYFPDDDYYPKPIYRPLIIYIIISLFSGFLV